MADSKRNSNSETKFGRYELDDPEHPGEWVQFATERLPYGLKRAWDAENSEPGVLALLLPKVVEWRINDLAGEPVSLEDAQAQAAAWTAWKHLPAEQRLERAEPAFTVFDNTDAVLVSWLVRSFTIYLALDSRKPPKA